MGSHNCDVIFADHITHRPGLRGHVHAREASLYLKSFGRSQYERDNFDLTTTVIMHPLIIIAERMWRWSSHLAINSERRLSTHNNSSCVCCVMIKRPGV